MGGEQGLELLLLRFGPVRFKLARRRVVLLEVDILRPLLVGSSL